MFLYNYIFLSTSAAEACKEFLRQERYGPWIGLLNSWPGPEIDGFWIADPGLRTASHIFFVWSMDWTTEFMVHGLWIADRQLFLSS